MKITFDKNIKLHDMLEHLEWFVEEGNIVLGDDVVVSLAVNKESYYFNFHEGEEYSFGRIESQKLEEKKKREAGHRLELEWEHYSGDYHYKNLLAEIEADHRYLQTAEEKGRSIKNIESRKKALLKHENELQKEKERLNSLEVFIDLFEKKKVRYSFTEFLPGKWYKEMIFELDEIFIFSYESYIIGRCELIKKSDVSK